MNNLQQVIKDQQERIKEKARGLSSHTVETSNGEIIHSISEADLDNLTKQTADAVLAAVMEMIEGKKYTKDHEDFDMWSEYQGGYNNALDEILSQIQATDPVHDFFTASDEIKRPVYERALQKTQETQLQAKE